MCERVLTHLTSHFSLFSCLPFSLSSLFTPLSSLLTRYLFIDFLPFVLFFSRRHWGHRLISPRFGQRKKEREREKERKKEREKERERERESTKGFSGVSQGIERVSSQRFIRSRIGKVSIIIPQKEGRRGEAEGEGEVEEE